MMLSRLAGIFSLCVVVIGLCACASKTTTVILVRHAERAPGAPDPPLSAAGQQRAAVLADVVADAGITNIYVTQFVRTQQTVAPTASAIGITPTIIPVTGTPQQHAAQVAARVREENRNAATLVCSHSNIVHLIAAELGATDVTPVSETEFDRLIVIVKTGNLTRVVQARYGAP